MQNSLRRTTIINLRILVHAFFYGAYFAAKYIMTKFQYNILKDFDVTSDLYNVPHIIHEYLNIGLALFILLLGFGNICLFNHKEFKFLNNQPHEELPTLNNSLGSPNSASYNNCLLYTSPSPRDGLLSRMPSSA
eukprot:TRINITY_DN6728_c0_g1_i7.p2 TRINITY_DN6728_c0_g1~~TRINITY_DN6728_c0_g1_i7.p2  ORF type:complete len:134 (+),score=39.52 TRINITY_DN6728_c0_g1_i7:724-1125(+)